MPSSVGATPASLMDLVDCRRADAATTLVGRTGLVRRTACVAAALAAATLGPAPARAQASAEPSLSSLPILRVVDTAYVDTAAHACVRLLSVRQRTLAGPRRHPGRLSVLRRHS